MHETFVIFLNSMIPKFNGSFTMDLTWFNNGSIADTGLGMHDGRGIPIWTDLTMDRFGIYYAHQCSNDVQWDFDGLFWYRRSNQQQMMIWCVWKCWKMVDGPIRRWFEMIWVENMFEMLNHETDIPIQSGQSYRLRGIGIPEKRWPCDNVAFTGPGVFWDGTDPLCSMPFPIHCWLL